MPDYRSRLEELSKKTGASVEEDDIRRLEQTNEDDRERLFGAYESQYERRGASQHEGDLPDSSEYTRQGYGSARSETADDVRREVGPPLRGPDTTPTLGGSRPGVSSAYGAYLGGGMAAGPQAPAPQQDPMLAKLVEQLTADRTRQEAERAEMRKILMSQLGEATTPVSETSPGIKPVIDAQKLALQRGAQRQRSAAVERAGVRGLGDSGALDTRINQIEQGRGEGEADAIARIMGNELNAKRQQVMGLIDLAVRSGDTESARTLQGQLSTLDQQMQNIRFNADLGFRDKALGVQDRQFGDDLGFRRYAFDRGEDSQRYRFDNDLAYRLAQLQLMGNQGSMGFLGGLI